MNKKRSTFFSEGPNQTQGSENEKVRYTELSSFRIIASQCAAIFPVIFINLRCGTTYGFTNILIPELSKKDAEIDVTLDELTWFSSYCFVFPVAAMSGGFIAHHIGIRRLLMISYLLYISVDLLFYWADNAATILTAQVIAGFTGGIASGPTFTYVVEIVQTKMRTTAMGTLTFLQLLGTFLPILLVNFMYWRTQILIDLSLPVLGFVFIHFIPDSPQWLASKNRFEDAAKSLARLRGWTTPEAVKEELYASITNASDSLSSTRTAAENNLLLSRRTELKHALAVYFDRSFYIPVLLVTIMFFITIFNGANALSDFTVPIFDEIKSPIDGYVANVIFSILDILSVFVYIFIVGFLGKRILALVSVLIIIICLTIAVILLYLANDNQERSETYLWIVSILFFVSSFVNSIGIARVGSYLSHELFPLKLRYVGNGIGNFILFIMYAILWKIFLYVMKELTFPGTIIVFIIINIVGFIVIYFVLPETEGVALRKIAEMYAS